MKRTQAFLVEVAKLVRVRHYLEILQRLEFNGKTMTIPTGDVAVISENEQIKK